MLTEKDINELLYENVQPFLSRITMIVSLCKMEPDKIVNEYNERYKELEIAKLKGVARSVVIQAILNRICDDYYSALLIKGWNDYQIHKALGLP